jgi:hypothetical protein
MESNVQLKINAINQLRLLRASTFKDKLCFLDEDIQNAQRAKAREFRVYVEYGKSKVIIQNNGNILDNPQALFSIAESGWDDEVKTTENPFGTGFFSNITVSNYIEIYSGNKHIIFDVENMINTNNTDIQVEETDENFEGFKLILNNFDFETASRWDIEGRVKILGNYVHELDVYFNDALIEKKDLTQGNDSSFQTQVEQDDLKGWLALSNNWFSNKLNIFYKGRLVTEMDDFPYVRGDLHISDKTLNLTSPDRKDIIRDKKLSEFKELIKIYLEDISNDALLKGDEEDIENYSSAISYYADKSKIKKLIKFATFDSKNQKDLEYLHGIYSAKIKNPQINNIKEYVLYLEKEERKKREESENNENEIKEDIESDIEIKKQAPEAKGVVHHESYHSRGSDGEYHSAYTERPEIKEEDLIERRGELLVISNEPTFWMSFNDIEKQEYRLNIAKHYNLKIIVARNKVEEEILKSMKTTDNILHISELKEEVDVKAILSNRELSIQEQRASMILDMISRQILDQDHNLFVIGDLMITKVIKVDSIDEENELVEDSVTVIKNPETKEIYIDRSIIDKSHLKEHLGEELELGDYKFILANLMNIVEEVSLLNLNSDNKDKTCNKILNALSRAI